MPPKSTIENATQSLTSCPLLLIGCETGVTVSSQVSSSDPALLVARMVTVWGLPTVVGLDQLTTPVVLLIVMPLGLANRDQVTGNVP